MTRRLPFAALLLAATFPAAAQLHWYAGASLGQSRTDDELVRNRESTITLVSTIHTDFDDTDTAWKVYGGVRFNRYVGLEAAYVDLGKSRTDSHGLGGDPAQPFETIINRKTTGLGLDLAGFLPLMDDRLDLIAKAGLYRTRLEADDTLEGNIIFTNDPTASFRTVTHTETTKHLGFGLQWWLTKGWAVRAEYERFYSVGKPFEVGGTGTTGEADVDAAWLGVVARF